MATVESRSGAAIEAIPPLDRLYYKRVMRAGDSPDTYFGQNVFVPVATPSNDWAPAGQPRPAPAGPDWAPWRTTALVAAASAGLWLAIIEAGAALL